jgi:hypothetical protein
MLKIGGVDKLTIDGTEYSIKDGAEVSLADHTKEVVTDQSKKAVGYIEKDFRRPFVKATIFLTDATPTDFLAKKDSISCELVYKNKTYIGSDGVNVSEETLNTEDGTMEIEIHFDSLVEA